MLDSKFSPLFMFDFREGGGWLIVENRRTSFMDVPLKCSFSEKATKIWKILPLVLTLLSKNIYFVKTGGRLFQILWPSHNVLTLFPTQFTSLTLPTTWNLFLAWPFMTFSVTFFSFQALNATYMHSVLECFISFYLQYISIGVIYNEILH